MKYHLTTETDGLRIGLEETLGFKDHQEFRRLVSDVVERRPSRVRLDLSRLSMLDSAGLGLLVILNEQVKQGGGCVSLSRPNEDVKRLLAVVEFDKLFAIDAAA